MNQPFEDDRHGAAPGNGHPEGEHARTGVAEDLVRRLGRVAESVAGMETCLRTGDLAPGTTFADALVESTTKLLDDLDRTLPTDPEWDAELISTLRVYRNAGFMFRKLAGADGRGDPAIAAVCAALIGQGHDHVLALLAQISRPARSRSGRGSSRSQNLPDAHLADALDPNRTLRQRAPTSEAQGPRHREH